MSKISDYINNNLSFRDEYENIFGRTLPYGKCMCCFHPNTRTPAAKMYDNKMHCFVCGRGYTVYDLLHRFNPDRIKQISETVIMNGEDNRNPTVNVTIVEVDRSQSLNEIYKCIINELGTNKSQ